jgi:hypothetical protein
MNKTNIILNMEEMKYAYYLYNDNEILNEFKSFIQFQDIQDEIIKYGNKIESNNHDKNDEDYYNRLFVIYEQLFLTKYN